MPDITMCPGGDCPKKEQCYRYKAKPDVYQYWYNKPPFKNGKCNAFIPVMMTLKRNAKKVM